MRFSVSFSIDGYLLRASDPMCSHRQVQALSKTEIIYHNLWGGMAIYIMKSTEKAKKVVCLLLVMLVVSLWTLLKFFGSGCIWHYSDVTMSTMEYQINSLAIIYSTVYLGVDQRQHQSSASMAFVWGFHRWPVNSPHKGPVTRKMFPFDDVIMASHMFTTVHYRLLLKIGRCNMIILPGHRLGCGD